MAALKVRRVKTPKPASGPTIGMKLSATPSTVRRTFLAIPLLSFSGMSITLMIRVIVSLVDSAASSNAVCQESKNCALAREFKYKQMLVLGTSGRTHQ